MKSAKKGKQQKSTIATAKQKLISAFMDVLSTTNETCKKSVTSATTTNRLKSGVKKSSAKPCILNPEVKLICCDECGHRMEGDIPNTPACTIFMLYVPDNACCFSVNSIRQDFVKYKGETISPVVFRETQNWTMN